MRYPAVAGTFYPANAQALERMVDAYLKKAGEELNFETARAPLKKSGRERKNILELDGQEKEDFGAKDFEKNIKAIVVPHAGLVYSGQCAAYSYVACKEILKKENATVILAGPNHTGAGGIANVSFDEWKTPLGKSGTDLRVAGEIIKKSKFCSKNEVAHIREHSLEVQLPFLQRINPKIKIVAINLGMQTIEVAKDVGKAVFDASRMAEFEDRNFVFVASSDFTHYESGERAKMLDKKPIEMIKNMDNDGLAREVEQKNLSICGYGAICAGIEYSKLAGGKGAKLLKYTNSGEQTGGSEAQVVAYTSMAIA